MVISFICFMALFVAVGISSFFKSRGTKEDYYLASASVSPGLVGLSAVATNNSGYMFIGIIGYTYATGLASIWLMLGWIAGDFLVSTLVHTRLREATEATAQVSYAGILSHWHGEKHKLLQRTIAFISLLFLLAYASAQLVAGSKALHVLLDWPMWGGAVLGGIMVALYCFAGGIRASIWTDAAQSIVMIFSMALLLLTAISSLGGFSSALEQMNAVDGFMDWFPKDLALPGLAGGILFAVSWMFAGLSVIGQPHVMVRFMALNDVSKMRRARLWYYGWYLVFYCMATGVGLLSRIYLLDTGTFDAELALPTMAIQLLSPALVGLILAGIFAATMSTADSLILSCSAAVTHDLLPHNIENTYLIKGTTLGVAVVALVWALVNSQSVFSLVVMAWSALASAFAPLLIVLCLGKKPSQSVSLTALFVGLLGSLLWHYAGWNNAVYEGMPGIMAGLSVFYLSDFFKMRASPG